MSALMPALQRAITICGGQAKLGSLIDVSQARISQWLSGEFIPVRYFDRIVAATNGDVTAYELLEDELAKARALEAA